MNFKHRIVRKILLSFFLFSICFIQLLHASQIKRVETPGSKYITRLFEDSKGFLWVSTQVGIFQYDGLSFTDHNTSHKNGVRINGGWALDFAEDKNGNLRFATQSGVTLFKHFEESYLNFDNSTFLNSDGEQTSVNCVFVDSKNDVWVGTQGGLFVLDSVTNTFNLIPNHASPILSIAEDKSSSLWLTSKKKVQDSDEPHFFKYNINEKIVTPFFPEIYELSYPLSRGAQNIQRIENFFVVSFAFHVAVLDVETGIMRVIHEGSTSGQINYAIGSTNNIFVFDNGNVFEYTLPIEKTSSLNEFVSAKKVVSNVPTIVAHSITSKDQNLWIGSREGLYKSNLRNLSIVNAQVSIQSSNTQEIKSQVINSISLDESGDGYVSTKTDLYRFTTENVTLEPLPVLQCFKGKKPVYTTIYYEPDKALWVGTQSDGLCKFNIIENRTTLYLSDNNPNTIGSNAVAQIVPSDDGTLWIASVFKGVSIHRPETGDFEVISGRPDEDRILSSEYPLTLGIEKPNSLWVGFFQGGGLERLDMHTKEILTFKNNAKDLSSLVHDDSTILKFDSNNNLWVGTFTAGISYLSEQNRRNGTFKFRRINTQVGLSGDAIYAFQEDQNGYMWVSTNNGLSKLTTNGNIVDTYGPEHGLQGDEFTHDASFIDEAGKLYFGGVNGISIFYPEDLKKNDYIPPVRLTNFLRLNQSTALADVENEAGAIQLTHKDYFFAFEFAAMDFTAPEKNQYRYKLEGFDEDWIEAGNDNRATYTNVPAGNYQFRVQGSNNDRVWNREGLTVPMTILPPLWKTWWAYTIYLILSITLLAWILTFRTRQLQKVNVKLEKAVDERTTELQRQTEALNKSNQQIRGLLEQQKTLFANVSHEFRTPLTLIISPLQKLATEIKDPKSGRMMELIYRNAKRLNRMVDQILELAKLETDQEIQYKSYDARKSLQEIVESFKPLVDLRSQTLTLDVQGDASMELIKDSFEKILSNLISNAVKYCPFGANINITCKIKNQQVEINVIDNGSGISSELLPRIFDRFVRVENEDNIVGSGLGLAYVKELVEANNGSIAVTSEIGHGTQFTLKLPASLTAANTLSDGISTPILYQFSPLTDAKFNPTEIPEDSTAENTILVVEDNPEMREFIVECLASVGQCLVAPDGAKGLEIATEMLPDLIITDLMMPKLNGHELVAAIRDNDITAHIPVVMLTAKGDDQSRIQGLKLNVDDYMSKPFSTEELQIRVTRLLSIRKMIQRRFGRNALDALVLAENEEGKDTQKINVEFDNERDRAFYDNFVQVVEEHYQDDDFSRALAAQKLFVSERQLNRKLSALIDYNFNDYLRKYRLEKAKKLLSKGIAVGDVSYQVGFSSQSYFGTCFKAEFGVTPRGFIEH